MVLSDELVRVDSYMESVVRKTERAVAESYGASKAAEKEKAVAAARAAAGGASNPAAATKAGEAAAAKAGDAPPLPFSINGSKTSSYVGRFQWDSESYDSKEPLNDLIYRLLSAAERVDGDLRGFLGVYQEKKSALQALERKRGGNLMVAGLEDVITPKTLLAADAEWMSEESEFLQTVAVVVPKASEEAWLACYNTLDAGSVPFGPAGAREATRGSPVVPGSARRIAEDKDGYCLYTVVILKKFADSFRAACKEKRFTVRDYSYQPQNAGSSAAAAAGMEVEVAAALSQLRAMSEAKYGEAVSLWMHVKAVRLFVESVLRYGLPPKFAAACLHIQNKGASNKALAAVQEAWSTLTAGSSNSLLEEAYGGGAAGSSGGKKEKGSDPVIAGITDAAAGGVGAFPFVFLSFDVKPDTAALASR